MVDVAFETWQWNDIDRYFDLWTKKDEERWKKTEEWIKRVEGYLKELCEKK